MSEHDGGEGPLGEYNYGSFFRMEELEQINKDRRVYLYIMGRQMPPVFLSVKSELNLPGGT